MIQTLIRWSLISILIAIVIGFAAPVFADNYTSPGSSERNTPTVPAVPAGQNNGVTAGPANPGQRQGGGLITITDYVSPLVDPKQVQNLGEEPKIPLSQPGPPNPGATQVGGLVTITDYVGPLVDPTQVQDLRQMPLDSDNGGDEDSTVDTPAPVPDGPPTPLPDTEQPPNTEEPPTPHIEREYDENGNVIRLDEYDEDGNLVSTTVYQYDEDGRLIVGTTYDGDGNLIIERTYIYDDEGHLIHIEEYRPEEQNHPGGGIY